MRAVFSIAVVLTVGRRFDRFEVNRLYRARRYRAYHMLSLTGVRGWLIPEGFRAVQPEDVWSEKTTLGIALAAIEIDDKMERGLRGLPGGLVCI